MRYYFLLVLLSGLVSFQSPAQKHTISGYIRDEESGESLIGAAVLHAATKTGTSSNNHGFFSLTLPQDSVVIVFSYVGYEPKRVAIDLKKDSALEVYLKGATLLDEVVVNAAKADAIHEINKMSSVTVPLDQIKGLPALLGEVDVMRVIQLMPGVKSSEGSTGLYVRGGGPDQNLLLLDGVPVYNASHLFGFFSVFNADAINKVELIKGGFPARYGGRLSSVIDISMKDGSMKEVHGEGSVGIIAAKATVEGPLVKDKTSFILSARRTYLDLLARPIMKAASDGGTVGYYFYDFNTKVNHIINQKNRVYASLYTGDDKAYARYSNKYTYDGGQTTTKDQYGLRWGNLITALRWNSVISPKLFSNVTTTFSKYRFNVFNEFEERSVPALETDGVYRDNYISGIRDWAVKTDFDYIPSPNHYMRFGVSSIWHRFTPGVYTFRSELERDTTIGSNPISANELAFYAEDDYRLTDRWKLNVGGHLSAFLVDDTWYTSAQPRISSRYLLTDELSLKASYATMTQFIHLLTNAGMGLPTDLWVPSTPRVRPQQASQVALGLARTIKSVYEVSVEGYYKKMSNLIEYKDGASFVDLESNWQDKIATNGRGESYGMEWLFQKKVGVLSGWAGYTLSWTNRQFDELNFGKWYPYKYDRRHDVSIALTHTWNKRMDFSAVWVYGTGNAVTLPVAQYSGASDVTQPWNDYYSGQTVNYYGPRNSYRMAAYHRLDLSFSFWKDTRYGQRKWTIGVYNAYSRRNPFFVQLGYDKQGVQRLFQYSLFPIIPSFTYSFKF